MLLEVGGRSPEAGKLSNNSNNPSDNLCQLMENFPN